MVNNFFVPFFAATVFFVLYYLEFLMYFLIFRALFFDYLPLKATEENNGGVHETLNSSTVNKKASYLLY